MGTGLFDVLNHRVWSLDFDRTGWNRWTSHRSRIERQGAEGFETICFGWIWRFSKLLSCLKSFEAAAAKSGATKGIQGSLRQTNNMR